MKRLLLSSFGLGVAAIIFSSHSGGVASGTMVSGSPGDANLNCTMCHSGGSTNTSTDLITTDIPGSGYVAGNTYSITVSVADAGATRFGFQMGSEDGSNLNVGTFADDGSSTVNTTFNSDYATHSSAISAAGSASWTFNWTAPSSGTGDVTFYVAGNAADGNGQNSGTDNIYTDSETVTEDVSSGISIAQTNKTGLTLYPNPAVSEVFVKGAQNSTVSIYNIKGSLIKTVNLNSDIETLNVSDLDRGTYFVTTSSNEIQKLIVQ